MVSASLQSRIQAFEALASPSTPDTAPSAPPAKSLLESPISPAADSFQPITPLVTPASSGRSRSPSPGLAHQTSLIDLKDWIVEDGPLEPSSRTLAAPTRKPGPPTAPLIHSDSPRPPLPPRKPSFDARRLVKTSAPSRPSLRSDSLTVEHTYPPGPQKFGAPRVGHAPASSVSSFHSVSLSSDGSHSPHICSQLPPSAPEAEANATDPDAASIAESFENVSSPSATSPSTATPYHWEQATAKPETDIKLVPPTLPTRPCTKTAPVVPPKQLVRSISGSSSSTATSTKTRRPPPPPPPYQPHSRPSSSRASVVSTSASTSDRSSILSSATTTSRTSVSTRNSAQCTGTAKSSSLLRPTPVPPSARFRYEALFDSAVRGRQKAEKNARKAKLLGPPPIPTKKRQAAGWRGVSVDLTTNQDDHPGLPEKVLGESDSDDGDLFPVGLDEKLNGRIVKHIWGASSLDRKTLGAIWNDCDTQRTGFVDRDAFVKGMWRIDEELRRAQLARRTSALTAASSQRMPHRPLLPARPQQLLI